MTDPQTEAVEAALAQRISEAALQPLLWKDVLPMLGHHIGGSDVCRITAWNITEDRSPLRIRTSSSIDDATIDEHERLYFTHYRKLDPRLGVSHQLHDRLGSDHVFLDTAFVARSEFFQDFMLPNGNIRWTAGGRILEHKGLYVDVAFERSADRPMFQGDELLRLNRLRPYLISAMSTHFTLREAGLALEITQAALDRLDQGVMVLRHDGALQLANSRGEALLREETFVKLADGMVMPADIFQRACFREALAQLARTRQAVSLTLHHRHGGPHGTDDCYVTVLPWAGAGNQPSLLPDRPWDVSQAFAIVLLTVKHAQRAASARQLMQLFQLTPAEARVARNLSSGHTVEETANDLALSIHTVRSHVKALLAKTGSANLSVLCTVLARIPSVRG